MGLKRGSEPEAGGEEVSAVCRSQRTAAIVLAAGSGRRMGAGEKKQFLLLNGKPLICHALEAFERSPVSEVALVVGSGDEEFCKKEIIERYGYRKIAQVVSGGRERYHSVYAGLQALRDRECEYVLIHDGARPCVTPELIGDCIRGAQKYGACAAGMPVKDTIKLVDGDCFARETPDRSKLWLVQTPQAFEYPFIMEAYRSMMDSGRDLSLITDDAMVAETVTGRKVKMIPGGYGNMKVTTPEDLLTAGALLNMALPEGKAH